MSLFVVNEREIRSFRLRFLTNNFYSFFIDKTTSGLFMSCASIQPEERIALRGLFSQNNLEVVYIGKNISRLIFSSSRWAYLKNLLQGGVVLIRDKSGNFLSVSKIKYILSQKFFYFRFLFWNSSIYRLNRMLLFFTFINKKKEQSLFFVYSLIFSSVLCYSPFIKKFNCLIL